MQRKGRHIMFYDTLNTEEQVSYLIKPIIEAVSYTHLDVYKRQPKIRGW